MLYPKSLTDKTAKVLVQLDPIEYPEAYEYLEEIFEDDVMDTSPFEIATELMQRDKPKDFPDFLVDYITTLYMVEIAKGNANAMNDLGAQYYDGSRGFDQDFSKSLNYYKMAADNGSRSAQQNLGYCYYYGRSIPVDYEMAYHYFSLGAFAGELNSLYKIGDMFLNGYYVQQDVHEAFLIYMRCLETMTEEEAGNVAGPIYLRLGNMFLQGLGVEADAKSALVAFQKAEMFLFDMVKEGNIMYRKSLDAAVEGQQLAREVLEQTLPSEEWMF